MTNTKLFQLMLVLFHHYTAQKAKFSIKEFFSKYGHIRSFLQIWLHLLKKSLMGNFTFCATLPSPAFPNHPSIKKNVGNPAPHLNKPVHRKKFDVHNTTVFVCNFTVCNNSGSLAVHNHNFSNDVRDVRDFLRSRSESCVYNRLNGLNSSKTILCLSLR